MTASDDAKPLAGTVFNARQVRLLKLAVIVMGLVLVGGVVALLSVIVYQARQLGTTGADGAAAPAAGAPLELPLPPGADVSRLALDGDRLAVQVDGPQGREILVLDLKSGAVLARVRLRPQ